MDDPSDVVLAHYGVKGMKWGRRKEREPEDTRVHTRPGKKVKAEGGRYQDASEDAIRSAHYKQVAKKSTTDSLSTVELREMVNRMQLEQQYDQLTNKKQTSRGLKIATAIATNPVYSGVAISAVGAAMGSKHGNNLPIAVKAAAKFGLVLAGKLNTVQTDYISPLANPNQQQKKKK